MNTQPRIINLTHKTLKRTDERLKPGPSIHNRNKPNIHINLVIIKTENAITQTKNKRKNTYRYLAAKGINK